VLDTTCRWRQGSVSHPQSALDIEIVSDIDAPYAMTRVRSSGGALYDVATPECQPFYRNFRTTRGLSSGKYAMISGKCMASND
jgi:hypothetical protein